MKNKTVRRWTHPTANGPVHVLLGNDGRYWVTFDGENLGGYDSLIAAIEDVAGGHTYWPSCGIDPSTLGISTDPADWEVWPLGR